jgi:thiol-disulfide isomerase/thioredoxin
VIKLLPRAWAILFLPAAISTATITTVTPTQYRARIVAPHRGRVLAVNFWATWCVPCREEMPALVAAGRRFSGEGVDIVLVSADFSSALPAVDRFLRGFRVPFPCFLEESEDPQTFIDAVDPRWGGELPHTVVYSRAGARLISLSSRQTREDFEFAFRKALKDE